MAKDESRDVRQGAEEAEETQSISQGSDEHDGLIDSEAPDTNPRKPKPYFPRRQSSFAQPRPSGTPRTPNRVRFDFEDSVVSVHGTNGHADPRWVDEEDFMTSEGGSGDGRRDSDAQRLPLLTELEAPSVTVASADVGFNAEDLLESARPKSGMRSAFMNMANSIMWVS